MFESVEFRADGHQYTALYGPVAVADLDSFASQFSSAYIVSDENVWAQYRERFETVAPAFVVAAGEQSKSQETLFDLLRWLVQNHANRKSVLIAIGGGVVGDLTGFAASVFMRGIPYANCATTLLAQVDAALGGKTGLNLPEGKNLVGTFHHPTAVWCDPNVLSTLPDREFRSGMAEVIKYGLAVDPTILELVESNFTAVNRREEAALMAVAAKCGAAKAKIVSEDPKETSGRRSVLNFGHTVGHAIESAMCFEGLLHGEAVAIGMLAETEIGEKLGMTPVGTTERVRDTLTAWGLPVRLPVSAEPGDLLERMRRDKKAESEEIAIALLQDVGVCRLVKIVPPNYALQVLEGMRAERG